MGDCDHQTGQEGCALLDCWGIPDLAAWPPDRNVDATTPAPRVGETGTQELGRELARACAQVLGPDYDHLTLPIYSDTDWPNRAEVRRVSQWVWFVDGREALVVMYDSRSPLTYARTYAAVYLDGHLVAGQLDGHTGPNPFGVDVALAIHWHLQQCVAHHPSP